MSASFPSWFRALLWMAAGGLLLVTLRSAASAVSGAGLPLLWWSARTLGIVATVALSLSIVFGLQLGGKSAALLPPAVTLALHQRWTLVSLLATAGHVLAVVVDDNARVGPLSVILPFASAQLRGPVALGTLALWGLALIAVSTALSAHIPRPVWRALHGLAFGAFALSVMHAATAGTDVWSPVVLLLVGGGLVLVLGGVFQRVLLGLLLPAGPAGEPKGSGAQGGA